MSEIKELKDMLGKHIEKSSAEHLEVKVMLGRMDEKLAVGKETMDKHGKDIEKLKWWSRLNVAWIMAAFGVGVK